jgi:exonuclease VII large subunit
VATHLDRQIDGLYQLPLDEFTRKRNALAKELSGSARTEIRHLVKPSLPAWAVNQLYWQERSTYSALVDASEKVRAAHRSMLSGHKADVRTPEQVHRATLERAVAWTTNFLGRSGLAASSAVLDTIRRALAALPGPEPAGRLTRAPEPAGFTLLTGVTPRPIKTALPAQPLKPPEATKEDAPRKEDARKERESQKQKERAEKAKQRVEAAASRKLQRAKQAAERAANRLQEAQRRLAELERG